MHAPVRRGNRPTLRMKFFRTPSDLAVAVLMLGLMLLAVATATCVSCVSIQVATNRKIHY